MVTLKKDNKIVKIQNDKYIIDAYLSAKYFTAGLYFVLNEKTLICGETE